MCRSRITHAVGAARGEAPTERKTESQLVARKSEHSSCLIYTRATLPLPEDGGGSQDGRRPRCWTLQVAVALSGCASGTSA